MHSHHSHSGSYVSHAVDDLDSVVAKAYVMGFTQFCLTEHMPRFDSKYMYPEEIVKGYDCKTLNTIFEQYETHARRLQLEYKDKMMILVGFEVEGADLDHIEHAVKLKSRFDMIVGSVHHALGEPIDFDEDLWRKARDHTDSKTSRELYKRYYEMQHTMIDKLKPDVVGHFDLISLFQPQDDVDPTTGKNVMNIDMETDWPEVWAQIVKNIELAASYGGLFELNSAAIRKGWATPYPKPVIAHAILDHGGRFCLSDDSHGMKQIGLNYHKVLEYVKELQLKEVYYLVREDHHTVVCSISTQELEKSPFWDQYKN
ncbi:histidinol-phosphatase [Yamadazyma tenuis]|uniref:Histidinol-phosphatase n=1 Tax=Candida tenuis (strain ATCC 10573 / BCRC 21748 / CBS 615 / JCM 9827 / NBRC 10315 / NRRL Y-1498 / VKM Y-70) TaxID=590646 RepID=G3B588_CANTC|nr:histidinolphosphatase [Yamadazyma tenuis ATCC 10573]EGV63163.1 histidinolphosphatase [Yamadazyma tenuis ATCC 10573]WEJ97017.1 histidinol-phosphatase [Yamadazyma tenuis]